MFVVRDWTRNPSYTMVSNDVKDVRDIVIGITGDETHCPNYIDISRLRPEKGQKDDAS